MPCVHRLQSPTRRARRTSHTHWSFLGRALPHKKILNCWLPPRTGGAARQKATGRPVYKGSDIWRAHRAGAGEGHVTQIFPTEVGAHQLPTHVIAATRADAGWCRSIYRRMSRPPTRRPPTRRRSRVARTALTGRRRDAADPVAGILRYGPGIPVELSVSNAGGGPPPSARPTNTTCTRCPSRSAGTGARFSAQQLASALTGRCSLGVLPVKGRLKITQSFGVIVSLQIRSRSRIG